MTIEDAQADLRRAFVGGGPGLVISGLFWLAAALVEARSGTGPAFTLLFLTGMLIFPAAVLVSRFLFARAPAGKSNPIARIAFESTIAMIGGLVIAWLLLPIRPEWVFPLAAIAVGTHFFAFRTAYGYARFWLLGALLTALGFAELFSMPFGGRLPLFVAAIEIAFGFWLTLSGLRSLSRPQRAQA